MWVVAFPITIIILNDVFIQAHRGIEPRCACPLFPPRKQGRAFWFSVAWFLGVLFQPYGSALCGWRSGFCAVCVFVCVFVPRIFFGKSFIKKNEPLHKTQRLLFVWLLIVPCTQAYNGFWQAVKNCFEKLPCKQHGKLCKCGYYAPFVLIHKKRSLFVCVLNLMQ